MVIDVDAMLDIIDSMSDADAKIDKLEDVVSLLNSCAVIQDGMIKEQYKIYKHRPCIEFYKMNERLPFDNEKVLFAYGPDDFGVGYREKGVWIPCDNFEHCQPEPKFWSYMPTFPKE